MSPWRRYGEIVGPPDDLVAHRIERRLRERLGDRGGLGAGRWHTRLAIAASLVVAAAVALVILRPHGLLPERSSAAVTIGTADRVQEVALPHGGILRVDRASRVEVEADEDSGAVVRLHQGEVELHVHARTGLRWVVESAGFMVVATGTRFRVRDTGAVPDVTVDEGTVRLEGPGLPVEGIGIAAVDPPRQGPHEAVRSSPSEGAEIDPAAPVAEIEPRDPNEDAPSPREPPPAWLAAFRDGIDRGDHAAAVRALPAGFPSGREPLAAADFLDAGDALVGRHETVRAERAYEAACRRRDVAACGVATFRLALLGARRGDLARAIALATRYLEEQPQGSLQREVVGRRMQWSRETGRTADARRDAEDYLARWPDGPHAALARLLARGEGRRRDP